MTSEQDGHLTQSPSGTRLSLFAWGSIGFRTFLNQAIGLTVSEVGGWGLQVGPRYKPSPIPTSSLQPPASGSPCPWHVIPRPQCHAFHLFQQVVQGLAAP